METKLCESDEILEKIQLKILNSPSLRDLSKEQLSAIAKLVVLDRYKDKLSKSVDIFSINYESEKRLFLEYRKSPHTQQAYNYALISFEKYIFQIRKLKSPLQCTQAIADDYIYSLIDQGYSPKTIDRNIGAIGSFFSFLERRTNGKISNVFRGTKARPKVKSKTKDVYPNDKDIEIILKNIKNKILKVIVFIMVKRGLRVGAFENMKIYGNKFYTESKGKNIVGILPKECIIAVRKAHLNFKEPFNCSTSRIKNLFKYHTKRLKERGLLNTAFSCHDLRHYFAIKEYNKNKDIYRVSKLLNHSSISVTETYLKGLNLIV